MTPVLKYLEEVEKRCEAACPGPWRVNSVSDGRRQSIVTSQSHPLCDLSDPFHRQCHHGTGQDAEFIAAARSDVPKLCAALRVAVNALETYQLEAKHNSIFRSAGLEEPSDWALSQITALLERAP